MNSINFYKPEKNANLLFLLVWIILMLSITISLSYLYCLSSLYMPIIYFSVLITCFYGLSIGYLVRFTSKIFRITSKRDIVYLSIFCGVISIYASWVAYLTSLEGPSYSNSIFDSYLTNSDYWLNPFLLFEIMNNISKVGLWEIFGTGTPVTGTLLWIVWIAEALILIFAPLLAIKSYQVAPFSARSNKWYKKFILNDQFNTIINIDKTLSELAQNPEKTMNNFSIGETNRHSIVSIHYLREESKQYLKIDNVRYDRKGKLIHKKTAINNLEISTQSAESIIKKYFTQKDFFFD